MSYLPPLLQLPPRLPPLQQPLPQLPPIQQPLPQLPPIQQPLPQLPPLQQPLSPKENTYSNEKYAWEIRHETLLKYVQKLSDITGLQLDYSEIDQSGAADDIFYSIRDYNLFLDNNINTEVLDAVARRLTGMNVPAADDTTGIIKFKKALSKYEFTPEQIRFMNFEIAALEGNLEEVKRLSPKIDSRHFTNIATKAVQAGKLNITKYLISLGADIDSIIKYTLIEPQMNFDLKMDIVKYLIPLGANVKNIMKSALPENEQSTAIFLIQNGYQTSDELLYKALELGNIKLVKYLIDSGINFNKDKLLSLIVPWEYDDDGNSIPEVADIINDLLVKGANLDVALLYALAVTPRVLATDVTPEMKLIAKGADLQRAWNIAVSNQHPLFISHVIGQITPDEQKELDFYNIILKIGRGKLAQIKKNLELEQ